MSASVDQAIDRLAARQHGVFGGAQAMALGATHRLIGYRVAAGRWIELDHFTFGYPSTPPSWERTLMASVLGESSAVVDGVAAAGLHAMSGFGVGRPELVTAPGSNHRSRLAQIHERSDVQTTVVHGIPVISLVDTVFVLAGKVACRTLAAGRLRFALDDSLGRGQIQIEQLQSRYLDLRASRRPGLPLMRGLIGERSADDYVPPATVLECHLYDVLDGPGMPPYRRQFELPWSPRERVDAVLTDVPVIIEADGRCWHARVDDFERDRRRDREAALHGFRTLRYTYTDLTRDPARVAAEILSLGRAAA